MTNSARFMLPAALLAAACNDTNLTERRDPVDPIDTLKDACIEVTPTNIEFEPVDIADPDFVPEGRTVTVSNVGGDNCGGTLKINSIQFGANAPAGVFAFANVQDVQLEPGDSTEFTVTFDPPTAGDYKANIQVFSNDPKAESVNVRLKGQGIAPAIQVTPDTFDYGAPYIGCENSQPLSITNQGNAPLVVSNVEVFTASVNEFDIDLDAFTNGNLPFTIAPFDTALGGPTVDVYLDYLALDTFKDDAYVTFNSNDPFRPEYVSTAKGTGTKFGDNLDIFEQPLKSASDILFTLDRSCSFVSDDIDNTLANMDVFVSTLASLDADFHAAIVVQDSGCVVGPDGYIDRSFSESAAIDAMRIMADADFTLSGYGSNTERPFMLAEAGLSAKNIGPGGCNEEFYREDAFLSIVFMTDEPEQSVSSWSYYVALYQSLKADPEDVKINAVAGDYPAGCATGSAFIGGYEAVVATGGIFLSVCSTDWAEKLESLAAESVSINDSFELTQQPVPQTIEVKIDGVRVNVGWEYEISSNSVVFDTDFIPAGGSTVEIYYERLPDCEG